MKRVLAISFLFVSLIAYFIPVTSVKADVTWGENNSNYLSNEEFYTCRQLATLDMISQLCSNGVNDLSISNADSVDEWIIDFLQYIDSNAENGVGELYSICNEIKSNIDYTATRIGTELKSFGVNLNNAFDDIIDWFDSLTTVEYVEYRSNPNFITSLNRLSRYYNTQPSTPTPNPDSNYETLLNFINSKSGDVNTYNWFWFWNKNLNNSTVRQLINFGDYTWVYYEGYSGANIPSTFNGSNSFWAFPTPIRDLHIVSNGNGNYSFVDYPSNNTIICTQWQNGDWIDLYSLVIRYNQFTVVDLQSSYSKTKSSSGSLNTVLNYIKDNYKNVNIWVDDVCWSYVGGAGQAPISLDINGIDFYGNTSKDPITYYYPNGTQIDYKKLYDVIKRAIDNSTSINNQTIWEGDTYYDSHDNVYTPNIYNYYNDDDNESESDVLEDIINLAIIPKFDIALLQPIEEPITNGEKIMFLGVQSLPEDILFVIGAGFVLILFGAMINRLIE